MTTIEEVAGWLREAADDHKLRASCSETATGALTPQFKEQEYRDRAAQVEAMETAHELTRINLAELAKAIRDAAVVAGICNDDVSLTGPELIMLCADMGAAIKDHQVEAMGWRPIADAPKDATFVDLWNSSLKVRMTDCLWSKGCWRKRDEVDQEYVAVADGSTHFMLPLQPPVKK